MTPSGKLVILTGASGSGKTTIVDTFETAFPDSARVFHFDSVGVPPEAEMIARFGSGEEWQRAMTHDWISRLAALVRDGANVVFEGQMRIAFVLEALAAEEPIDAICWLVDCSDRTRYARLEVERGQPHLASGRMMNWARYLRNEAEQQHLFVLDTDRHNPGECVHLIEKQLGSGPGLCNASATG